MVSERFRRFWRGGGRITCIVVPSVLGLHYLWYKLQYMDELTPPDKQKKVVRVANVLITKEGGPTIMKPSDFMKSYETEDRKDGK